MSSADSNDVLGSMDEPPLSPALSFTSEDYSYTYSYTDAMCSYDVAMAAAHTAGHYNQRSLVMQQVTTWRSLPAARQAKLAQLKLGQPATEALATADSNSHTGPGCGSGTEAGFSSLDNACKC